MNPPSATVEINSRCVAVTPNDPEENGNDSYVEDSVTVLEAESELECESGLEEESVEPVTCDLCGQTPCEWEVFGEEIWEECNSLKEADMENKAVRHHAYKMYTRMRHGVLHRFDRRPLPVCIRGEIMDAWPEADHVYVGFQMALRAATDDNS
jgi:hypothetical protein